MERGGNKKEHTTEGPEELQTDTSLLIYTVYVCVCVFRQLSICFFLVWLIKGFGLSISLHVCSKEFLSPSIYVVAPRRCGCCSQLVKWATSPEARATHEDRAS